MVRSAVARFVTCSSVLKWDRWLPQMRPLLFEASTLLLSLGACGFLFSQQAPAALRQADADYRTGVAALNSGDLKTAQEKFESVVKLEPGLEQGHSALGAVLVREGKWPAGIHELERAVALKPGDDAAQLNLALAYAQTGAHAKAVPLFAKVETAARAHGSSLPSQMTVLYAESLAAIGHRQAAIAQLKQVAAQGGAAQIHDDLGSLYAQDRDWPQAEQEFEQALRSEPNLATAHLQLGFVLQAERKSDPAAEWMRAYELAPRDTQIAVMAGKALAEAGQDEKAEPILEHALQLAPRSSDAAYGLALVYQRTNRVPDAIKLLKNVVEEEPKNTDALINLGLGLSQQHLAQDALPYLKRAIALDPNSLTAHQDLAAAYIQVDQLANAITELRAALKLAPDSPKVHYDLGAAYKLQDDATDAIPQLEAAEKLDPTGYEAPYVLGVLYNQIARYPEAAQQLESSLKLHSRNGDGWSTLGTIDLKLNKLPEAANALRKAIEQLPGQSDPHLLLANVLIKQGNTAEAEQERKVAAVLMRAHMNRQRAEVATNSGKSLLSTGKVDDAIVEFHNAIGFDPQYAEAHAALADALDQQGNTQEAQAERNKAKVLQAKEGAPAAQP
jgi:protein O-GlcNAc transferase